MYEVKSHLRIKEEIKYSSLIMKRTNNFYKSHGFDVSNW